MKQLAAVLLLFFLGNISVSAQEEDGIQFPNDYFGIYKGTLEVSNSKGDTTYPMEFHLNPTDSIGKYEYKLVYGAGVNRQERPYHLIVRNAAEGTYIVDENNGILLDDKVVGNRMYSLFEVGDNLLTTFITFEKDHMIFEITVSKRIQKQVTYANNEAQTEVISYPISTVQRAVLQKQ